MPGDQIRYALGERNRTDRKDVRFQLLMGIPFSLFGLLVANVLALPLIYVISVFVGSLGCGVGLLILNAVLVTFILIDLKRHPDET